MTFQDALSVGMAAMRADVNLLLVGAPGCGKSALAKLIAERIGADVEVEVASIADLTDPKGLGVYDAQDKQAKFVPYAVMERLVKAVKPTVFILEDVGQAAKAIQAAFMQVIWGRTLGDGRSISKHVRFIATTNDQTHAAGVGGIIEPFKSRMMIIPLQADVDAWIKWAVEAQIPAIMSGFVKTYPKSILEWTPTQGIANGCCPRGLEMLGRLVARPEWDDFDEPTMQAIATGCIGAAYGAQFVTFRMYVKKLPSYKDIVRNAATAKLPNDPTELITVMNMLAYAVKQKDIVPIMRYIQRAPAEFQSMFIQAFKHAQSWAAASEELTLWHAAHPEITGIN